MDHNHAHSHLGNPTRQTTSRLALSLSLTAIFVVLEAAAGLFANSLALLTDAAHNFTDVIALGLSWYAVSLTTRPSNSQKTYGYHRAGILVALVNSTTLVLISLGVFYEAYQRFKSPPEIKSGVLVVVGIIAVAVNLVTALLVRRGSEHDLNLRSVFLHLMGDVFSTVGAVIAGVIIYFTHANWLDPFISVLIGFLILYNAWGILRETVGILLESTPRDVDMLAMVADASYQGDCHWLAVRNGGVWAWGDNTYGQLGDATTTQRLTPVQIDSADLTNITAIAAGHSSSYALSADGTLWVWGDNYYGQLGLGDTTNHLTPVHLMPPSGYRFTSIDADASGHHAVATLAPVPEPGTLSLLAAAGVGMTAWGWRRRSWRTGGQKVRTSFSPAAHLCAVGRTAG